MTTEVSPDAGQFWEARDQQFMRLALDMARQAADEGEVPVGSVLVAGDTVVAKAYNRNIADKDPSAHAEILVLRAAGQALGNHRLPECSLYVTLEPCCMCVGAIIHARLKRLVFAAPDPKTGAVSGAMPLLNDPLHNHRLEVEGGCLEDDSAQLLRSFFRARR